MRKVLIVLLWLMSMSLSAQPFQIVRGTVLDLDSKSPVPYAALRLKSDLRMVVGVTSDSTGHFVFGQVPVGRYDLEITCLGYEPALMREIVVISAKQTVLNVMLKENARELDEITVKPQTDKSQPLNSMATVSARMLSVEEAKRYAGGFDDPARLASAFAGVAGNTDVNGIIVRGNAPKYLQWRMEGIEIPNPNHFGDLRAIGGGVLTGLSSQMLANSDFFTGAFPAEYNNALSGVFDISMRKGNQQKTERTLQVGLIGIETAQEGPFKKGRGASYLYNYRNATLALLEPMLPENANSIRYQDLSFKLHFPTRKAGSFALWGIGLADGARAKAKTDSAQWFYQDDRQQNDIKAYVGAAGLSHTFFFNSNTYLKTTIATTANLIDWNAQTLNRQLVLAPYSKIGYTDQNYVLSTFVNKKISARHTHKTGITLTHMRYDVLLNRAPSFDAQPLEIVNTNGQSQLIAGYSASTIDLNSRLLLTVGLNAQFFALNHHYTVEPRIGLRQALGQHQFVTLGYGLHSRLEKLNYYLNNSLQTGEKAVNRHLGFSKAHHIVAGYERNIGETARLKVETYYQQLFDVPVIADSSFSLMNLQTDWFFAQKLQNTGEGQNYGIDITLERYMSKGYYYLITASLFEAKYKGGDGVWRDTRFNRNYVVNILAGREWRVGKNKQNTFGVNGRVTLQGGNRYSPVQADATRLAGEVIYDGQRAFSQQSQAMANFHLTIAYKKNKAKSSRELALKILNLTGQPDFYGYKYNFQTKTVDLDEASLALPNLSYKVEF